ncbi:unnamed protein product [Vicia faba]|uniref:Uncharacterized protein n=1 Tax=Vicia faba TaxID=3906 RepID=A0AAV0YVJ7_VICFA|nr:unnamed protein product [Vicia faba]
MQDLSTHQRSTAPSDLHYWPPCVQPPDPLHLATVKLHPRTAHRHSARCNHTSVIDLQDRESWLDPPFSSHTPSRDKSFRRTHCEAVLHTDRSNAFDSPVPAANRHHIAAPATPLPRSTTEKVFVYGVSERD